MTYEGIEYELWRSLDVKGPNRGLLNRLDCEEGFHPVKSTPPDDVWVVSGAPRLRRTKRGVKRQVWDAIGQTGLTAVQIAERAGVTMIQARSAIRDYREQGFIIAETAAVSRCAVRTTYRRLR